jgi:hypothetical protein
MVPGLLAHPRDDILAIRLLIAAGVERAARSIRASRADEEGLEASGSEDTGVAEGDPRAATVAALDHDKAGRFLALCYFWLVKVGS